MEEVTTGSEELVSLESAARELKTTGLKLLMLIKSGTMEGSMVEGEWFIPRSSLECFKAHGGAIPAGVEPSCRKTCKASSCGCG